MHPDKMEDWRCLTAQGVRLPRQVMPQLCPCLGQAQGHVSLRFRRPCWYSAMTRLTGKLRVQALMGGELGLGTMAGAAQSRDELAWQLDMRAATRVKGGAMRIALLR